MKAVIAALRLCVPALVLAACGSSATSTVNPAASARPSGGAGTAAPVLSAPAPGNTLAFPTGGASGGGGGGGGSFTLQVEGGTFAGNYTASQATGGCFVNAGNLQLALEGPGAGPSGAGLFLTINALMTAATAGTSDFILGVVFGEVDQGGTTAGYPGQGGKDGNLKIDDKGGSVTFAANGSVFAVAGDGSSQTFKVNVQGDCAMIGRF